MVLEYLGLSLSDLFYQNNKKLSLKTVLMLAIQMISRLETIHGFGVLHRDIKPGNFVMGREEHKNRVFVIDFGLASLYLDEKGEHIPYNKSASFRGTHRYASINSHKRREQSRRDDLEALGYVLVYFLEGSLPWQNLHVPKKDRRKVIGDKKAEVSVKELTRNIPNHDIFEKYMNYCKKLGFKETPNYDYLRKLFSDCLRENNYDNDNLYDWTVRWGSTSFYVKSKLEKRSGQLFYKEFIRKFYRR